MSKKRHRLNRWLLGSAGVLTAAAVTNGVCADASDPLLDMLIKKGVLTEQEAREIKAEAETNAVPTAASKWKISDSIKSIGLFGDVRFRYEYRGANNVQGGSPSTYYRERFRYALRAGIRGDLFDHFNYGIRLETSSNPRSTWVTFGQNAGAPPSEKSQAGIYLGQMYLGWKPEPWYEMTVGKMPMPLYTTTMVWDSDINPEGAFEKFKFTVENVDLFAQFGQFVYQDTNPDVAIPSSDTFLLAWQVGAQVKLDKNSSFKIAPVVYNHVNNGQTAGLNTTFVGQGGPGGTNILNNAGYNQTGIDNLLVVEIPAEYNLKLGDYHARVFGDFAYNVNGDTRARDAFNAAAPGAFTTSQAVTGQNTAYQFGLSLSTRANQKHGWAAQVFWQHIEQYSLDVNLLDSDLFAGRANLEGIGASLTYHITAAITGTARYAYAKPINNNLGTGGSNGDLPSLNPINNYNLVQLDLGWKF